jgi:hypothetical protein
VTASKGKTPTDDREHEQPGPDKPAAYVAGWHDGWAVGYQAGRQRREHSYDEPDKTAA